MNEEQARKIAEEYIRQGNFSAAMRTSKFVETSRSWIFEVVATDGEPLFGNAPLIVDKSTRRVAPLRAAWREFAVNLSWLELAKRRWCRWKVY